MARAKPHEPERRCVVTRTVRPPEALIRFVLAPDGTVTPDFQRRLPGRGAWVSATRGSVAAAAKRGVFARAFKKAARTPEDLADQVEAGLLKRALEALSLANKAGRVVAGFVKVESVLRSGEAISLLHAAGAGADGVRKLEGIARGSGRSVTSLHLFSGEQLDLALGRSHVIHAALKAGDVAKLLIERADALGRYRGLGL